MRNRFSLVAFLHIVLSLTISSCILSEYNINDVTMEDKWGLDIIVPLLKGDFAITNFIDEHNFTDSDDGNSIAIQYNNSEKYIDKNSLCTAFFENNDYDLTIIEGQEFLDSVNLIVLGKNDFKSDIKLVLTFKGRSETQYADFIFEIPKDSQNFKIVRTVSESRIGVIQNFTTIDIHASFNNCESNFKDQSININDQFQFSLVLDGIIKKYNNYHE